MTLEDDVELERAEAIAAAVRRDPAAVADAAALAASSGLGAAGLDALVRRHFHLAPADFLARERVEAARRALAAGAEAGEAAARAGFASPGALGRAFRRWTGMAPGEYRALGRGPAFALALPPGFRADVVLAYLGRDPLSPVERVRGAEVAKALRLDGRAAVLRVAFAGDAARCVVEAEGAVSAAGMREAHGAAVRMLGLESDPAAFERRIAARGEARLLGARRGLRIPLTADPWECLLWTIAGQQVNLAFAYQLRRTVVELAGEAAPGGMRAHPTPAAVAALDHADLASRRFSRRKAEYVVDTARLVASGALALDPRASAVALERRLLAVRGLGPWSAQYFLMRGAGLADCVPVGDAALTAALRRFFALEARPGPAETRALMERFAPFRSLATFHLWQTAGDG